jgi:hypothetical protein
MAVVLKPADSFMAQLPEDIRQEIFSTAGNPRITQVCREWRNYKDGFYFYLFLKYKNSIPIRSFMTTEIPEVTNQIQTGIVNKAIQFLKRVTKSKKNESIAPFTPEQFPYEKVVRNIVLRLRETYKIYCKEKHAVDFEHGSIDLSSLESAHQIICLGLSRLF